MQYGKYNYLTSKQAIEAFDHEVMFGQFSQARNVAYDTETNGLDIHESTIIGFSLSFNKDQGFYLPILYWVPDQDSRKTKTIKKVKTDVFLTGRLYCPWTDEYFDEFVTSKEFNINQRLPWIVEYLKKWTAKYGLFMHNAPFDVNITASNMQIELTNNLVLDSVLLLHALDENEDVGLKKAIERFRVELGINPHVVAAQEQKDLTQSIIKNGGKAGHVWRADLEPLMKYGCQDTNFTFGICEAGLNRFFNEFGAEGFKWFFEEEVMPVCREVVIPMKRNGVYVDVPYFKKIHKEIVSKMYSLEDEILDILLKNKYLDSFAVGKGPKDISDKAVLLKIIEMEGLKIPTTTNKKGEVKESLAKSHVKKAYSENPHWVWGYILGEDELKYSEAKIKQIRNDLFVNGLNKKADGITPLKRYQFNINSDMHLRWLFIDKLGVPSKALPKTSSDLASMGADVLEEFMLPKFPWVQKLLSYKKLVKQESTYIRPAIVLNKNGWLYMDMKQHGTTSGRFACSGGYNLQTLPRVADEIEILSECEACGSKAVEVHPVIECMANMSCKSCGHTKQDIPRPSAIKKGFIAPPGFKIVNADYSSLEPRCFAYVSGEDALKAVYRQGLDLYSQVYCEIFDEAKEYSAHPDAPNYLKKVAPAKRKFVKPIVLGIPYGAEATQVASMCGFEKEFEDKKTGEIRRFPDKDKGQGVIDAYLGKLSNLKRSMDDADFRATTFGFVQTIIGRRRHLQYAKAIQDVLTEVGLDYTDVKDGVLKELKNPTASFTNPKTGIKIYLAEELLHKIAVKTGIDIEKIKEKDNWKYIRALLKNELNNAKNFPIQGLAGSITNRGMLDTTRHFKQNSINGWVCLQIHDEIVSYVETHKAEFGAQLMQNGMEHNIFTAKLDIPMVAEPVVCDNLKDAK